MQKTGWLCKRFLAAALMSICSGAALAQLGQPAPLPEVSKKSGPSLEETQQWLSKKIQEHSGEKPYPWPRQFLKFEECKLRLVLFMSLDSYSGLILISEVSLDQLDEERPQFTIGKNEVVKRWQGQWYASRVIPSYPLVDRDLFMRAYSGNAAALDAAVDSIKKNPMSSENPASNLNSIMLFSFINDPALVPRVSNALSHAIGLCASRAAEAHKSKSAKKAGELF